MSVFSMESGFRWDDAKVLLALSRAGSLSAAAGVLEMNATTVGRRLTALEEELGRRLFDRTPDGVTKTAVAEEMLIHAEAMERSAHAMAGTLSSFESSVEGVVRISVPPGIADFMVAPQLARLRRRYPNLRVELDASVGYVDLARRQADLALRGIRPERGDLVSVRLGAASSIPMTGQNLAEELGAVAEPSKLPWITYGEDLGHIPDAAWVLSVAPPSKLVLRTSSFTTQVTAAQAGLGVMLAPEAMLAGISGLLAVKFTRIAKKSLPKAPLGTLHLVAHRSMRQVPRVAAVWDFLQQVGEQSMHMDPNTASLYQPAG